VSKKANRKDSVDIKYSIWDTRTKENLGMSKEQYDQAANNPTNSLNNDKDPKS